MLRSDGRTALINFHNKQQPTLLPVPLLLITLSDLLHPGPHVIIWTIQYCRMSSLSMERLWASQSLVISDNCWDSKEDQRCQQILRWPQVPLTVLQEWIISTGYEVGARGSICTVRSDTRVCSVSTNRQMRMQGTLYAWSKRTKCIYLCYSTREKNPSDFTESRIIPWLDTCETARKDICLPSEITFPHRKIHFLAPAYWWVLCHIGCLSFPNCTSGLFGNLRYPPTFLTLLQCLPLQAAQPSARATFIQLQGTEWSLMS